MKKLLIFFIALNVYSTTLSFAQTWPEGTSPVRGILKTVSDTALTVTTQTGDVSVKLLTPTKIYTREPSDLSHISDKTFVGVTSVKNAKGLERATEIHIFPEELRGVGEGSYMMEPEKTGSENKSRMTNGAVATSRMTNGSAKKGGDSTLTVQFKDGTQTLHIPKEVPVTLLALSKEKLKVGQGVLLLAKKLPDGSLTTNSIVAMQK